MKLLTYSILALFGCIMAVSALPSPIRLSKDQQTLLNSKSQLNASLHAAQETFVRDDDPLFARYFDDVYEISEREFAEATTEPPIVKRNMLVSVSKAVVEGIVKIVQWIKAKIEADKQVRNLLPSSSNRHNTHINFNCPCLIDARTMDKRYGQKIQTEIPALQLCRMPCQA